MAEQPSKEDVKKALAGARSRDRELGRVTKVLFLDDDGKAVGEYASSQIQENPWAGQMSAGLVEPPFRLEQLVYLAEMHPVHSAALEQKMLDMCGKGWEWSPRDEEDPDEDWRDEIDEWFESLAPDDFDMRENLQQVVLDIETTGWGTLEVVRNASGIVERLYHVPAHTVRAHRDGWRLAQVRDSRKVWFRRWGAPLKNNKPVMIDAVTGAITVNKVPNDLANDLLVIRKPARRSSWYGIPSYISSIGWITLSLAARDDNLFFFTNRREPRWAIILSNLADDPQVQEDLRRAFVVDLRQPYRNLMIPITGPGKIDFQKLTDQTAQDGSFADLDERANHQIMVSHRTPAERIANANVGPLGGNIASEANRIYKEAVVQPGQELINSRINRFLEIEYPLVNPSATDNPDPDDGSGNTQRVRLPWKFELDDLDLGTEREELDLAVIMFHSDLSTLREARARLKMEPLMKTVKPVPQLDPVTGIPKVDPASGEIMLQVQVDEDGNVLSVGDEVESPYNDMLFTELPGAVAAAGPPGSPPVGSQGLTGTPVKNSRDMAVEALGQDVKRLFDQARRHDTTVRDAVAALKAQRSQAEPEE
jgi:PBSX family phage portal protein